MEHVDLVTTVTGFTVSSDAAEGEVSKEEDGSLRVFLVSRHHNYAIKCAKKANAAARMFR